ncbi:MAG: threonylcarbamoyl-AMP synthase [Treponema sp.]|jgi:L-threonylcarbamoyladenylate synthase|nr:threonylcarbamoyl-AMP synthase [Treponema sp.]
MPLLPVTDENIKTAAAILAAGGLVAFPTETVYGLGGDAFNPLSLAKIFEVKNRPRFDPLIVHIALPESLEEVAALSLLSGEVREKVRLLTGRFWPGPLTLILPKNPKLPGLATSGLATAAVRLPDHPAAQELIRLAGTPVAAPSANPFGYLSPTRAEHVAGLLGDRIDLILDGGPCRVGLESTVLDMSGPLPRLLRPGGLPLAEIEALIGPAAAPPGPAPAAGAPPGPRSPGQLGSHYAPRTGLTLLSPAEMAVLPYDPAGAYLFFDPSSRNQWLAGPGRAGQMGAGGGTGQTGALLDAGTEKNRESRVRVLSETGDLTQAAANLFDILHEMDGLGLSRIYAERVREEGLGPAINDRLFRATEKKPAS